MRFRLFSSLFGSVWPVPKPNAAHWGLLLRLSALYQRLTSPFSSTASFIAGSRSYLRHPTLRPGAHTVCTCVRQ